MSSILLAKNSPASSGKRTKHINVRYFFITDRIKKGELEVRYCPTKEIIGDFFTKPLQGATFQKFRDQIMGISDVPTVPEPRDHRSVLGESVALSTATVIPSNNMKQNMREKTIENSKRGSEGNCWSDKTRVLQLRT